MMAGAVTKYLRAAISKLIKEKRLIFKDAENISYTDKHGVKTDYTLDGMADFFISVIEAADPRYTIAMGQAGISRETVSKIIVEEYNRRQIMIVPKREYIKSCLAIFGLAALLGGGISLAYNEIVAVMFLVLFGMAMIAYLIIGR
jgi:hypothetical protein